jgi:hypothetical protein
MLVAPAATPLYARLAKEGRLVREGAEIAAAPWSTNINPKKMTRDQLYEGIRWLVEHLADGLANHMQRATAARARTIFDAEPHVLAVQMGRQAWPFALRLRRGRLGRR